MFCNNCGAQIQANAKFCTNCGTPQSSGSPNTPPPPPPLNGQGSGLVGFSNKAHDPAFEKFKSDTKKGANIFALIMIAALTIGGGIYGAVSRDADNPQAILIGFGLGVAYYIFGMIFTRKQQKVKPSWDGVVADKTAKKRWKNVNYGDTTRRVSYMQYVVHFKGNNGESHKVVDADDQRTLYDYYQIGEKVRYHGHLNAIEKYDKRGVPFLICAACTTINDVQNDNCRRCKVPLLK